MKRSDINVGDRLLVKADSLAKPRHWPHLDTIVQDINVDRDKTGGFDSEAIERTRGEPARPGEMAAMFRWAFSTKPWDQLVASSAAVWLVDIDITEVGVPWKAKMDAVRGTVRLSVRQHHLCDGHSVEDCRIFCNEVEPAESSEGSSDEENRALHSAWMEWRKTRLVCAPLKCNHADHHLIEERDVVVHFSTLEDPVVFAAEQITAKAAYVPSGILLKKRLDETLRQILDEDS